MTATVLIWAENEKRHDLIFKEVLERARQQNLKFNKEKSHIKLDRINYIGHVLSKEGLRPDPTKVEAIEKIDSPRNKDLQRFLGMITYLRKFIPNNSTTEITTRKRHWGSEWATSLTTLKKTITEVPVLKFFEPIKISVDASSKGLGATLIQDDHPVAYASKSLTHSQQQYAQIVKEMLAIVFGCVRFHDYIYGMPAVEVETDHKPLESMLNKPLHQAPPRLQKMIYFHTKIPNQCEVLSREGARHNRHVALSPTAR